MGLHHVVEAVRIIGTNQIPVALPMRYCFLLGTAFAVTGNGTGLWVSLAMGVVLWSVCAILKPELVIPERAKAVRNEGAPRQPAGSGGLAT